MTVAPEALSIEVPAPEASLDDWLSWLETIHPVAIDMGLERVSAVADRLQLKPANRPMILVGGTNGKGSTVAMLSSIYTAAGYQVGAYTSPHIEHFCERIKINQQMVDERDVVQALAFVEAERKPQTLTYFEYTTLAAMRVFMQHDCDIYLFEVGLGGRLDATNLWDADCAILTSIALDHESYLGSDISVIATEKAAIGRSGKALIVGETDPPESLFAYAEEHQLRLQHVVAGETMMLPETAMSGLHQQRNAACAMAAVRELASQLPVNQAVAEHALSRSFLSARFERLTVGSLQVVLDVAHNPAGAYALTATWQHEFPGKQAEVIFAALGDKDLSGITQALAPIAAAWHCIELEVARASSLASLRQAISESQQHCVVHTHPNAAHAWRVASHSASVHGRPLLVAGSFHTIAIMRAVIAGLT